MCLTLNKMEPYKQVAEEGDLASLMNMNVDDYDSIIRIAIKNNNVDIMRWAIEVSDKPNRDELHNLTLLASQHGSTQVLECLMDLNDDLGYDWVDWDSLAQASARIGDIETIKYIVKRANRDDGEFDNRIYWRKTMRIAFMLRHQDIVNWFANRF